MTQEDKLLLLQDLSSRLPYEIYAETINELGETHINRISPENINLVFSGWWRECKPYLRPMSSMTKDEVKEFQSISNFKCYPKHIRGAFFNNDYTPFSTFDSGSKFCRITMSNVISCIDWLLKKLFDFRDLIEKGLALEAPKDMYK